MKRQKQSRVKASLSCLFIIIILGVGLAVIYKNVNSKKDKPHMDLAVPVEERESFYNSESESDSGVLDRSLDDLELLLDGRSLTGSVIPYDGQERNIVCWGDSMTEGVGASHAIINVGGEKLDISYWTYPDALEYLTGIDTYNYGVSGEDSREIAVRSGGIKLYTDRDVVVGYNHSGDVKVTDEYGEPQYVQNFGGYGNAYDDYYGVVYIDGQMYSLTGTSFNDEEWAYDIVDLSLKRYSDINDGNSVYQSDYDEADAAADDNSDVEDSAEVLQNETKMYITASEAMELYGVDYYEEFEYDDDTCIVIPAGTLVTPKAALDHSNDILILEIGSNGGWQGDYSKLIEQYDSIIERFGSPYYIIVGDTDDPEDSADPNQGMKDENGNWVGIFETYWETALRQAYGDHFFNTRVYMLTNGLSDAGKITTRRDLNNIKKGKIPKKLRADWTHFNSLGYYSKAMGIYQKGIELGYWD